MGNEIRQKHTAEPPLAPGGDLEAVLDRLTIAQIRFVVARNATAFDKDAARAIGLSASTVKSWPKEQKADIAEARRLMAIDGITTAMHIRRRHLAQAMAVKVAGLESDDERVRQSVATEIVEWELGKSTQRQENKHGALEVHIDDALDRLTHLINRQAATGAESDDPGQPVE